VRKYVAVSSGRTIGVPLVIADMASPAGPIDAASGDAAVWRMGAHAK
jgi:hypothetical protein